MTPSEESQFIGATEAQAEQLLELTGRDEPQIEILRGVSFGTERIQRIFQGAGWTFSDNGKFTFTPQFSQFDSPRYGTYTKVGSNFEFQGEQASDDNSTISIDGTIRINQENLILDVVYTNSGSPQQIARISQSLTKGRATQKPEPVPSSENLEETEIDEIIGDLETELEALCINDDLIEKEIEGIKTPSEFKIFLEGKTDRGVFSSLPGTLFIQETAPGSQSPFSISLVIEPDLYGTNGWIFLTSQEAGQETPNIQIQANNGQVRLELSPSKAMRQTTYTLGADESSPDLDRSVLIENAILTFSVEGNRISGEIKASGIQFPAGADEYFSDAEQSTYEAQLTGEIPTSPPVEKLKAFLASSFNGQWDTDNSSFGEIKLQQNGQQVRGTYTGGKGGTIVGTVQGNRLDFTWQAHQKGEKGRGFFRAVSSGGTLAGIWWRENRAFQTQGESLIASWQLPSFITTGTFSPFAIQELKNLGYELVEQSRWEQAVQVLDQVISFYQLQQQTQKPEEDPVVINSALPLIDLTVCNFNLGNYDKLLNNLEYGLEILRILGPEESASRLLRQQTAKLAKSLTSDTEIYGIMENGYNLFQQIVNGSVGVIGISVEQSGTTKEIVVASVEKGQPTDLTGIMPQDVIVKIDRKITQGMDEQQVTERLRGTPETPVTVNVRRGNQELEFQLLRTQIEIGSAQRQAELIEAITFFANSQNSLRDRLENNLHRINTSARRIGQGIQEPVSALLSIIQELDSQIIELNQETNVLFDRGREVFSQQEEALQELELIFSQLKIYVNNNDSEIEIKYLDAIEKRMMELIENDQTLSSIEKKLFKGYYTDITQRLTSIFALKDEKNLLEKIDAQKSFEDNKKRSLEMTSGFADRLETWRTRLVEDLDKIQALDQGQPFFKKALKFLISLGYEEEALVIYEKSRTRAFADILATRSASTSNSKSILQSIAANSPTLKQIKQIAQEQKATLVEYAIIDDLESQLRESKILIWIVKPTGQIEFNSIELLEDKNNISLKQLVSKALASIGIKDENITDFKPPFIVDNKCFYPHLRQLYQILIESIGQFLPDDPNAPLIFIPQDCLFLIPFSALQDEEGDFLIQKHTILTAPSIQVLDLTHQPKKEILETSINALVVGNPTMPSLAEKLGEKPKKLKELPAAKAEAKIIASLLKTQAIIGTQATKVNIIAQMPQARLIHFSTHGKVDPIRPLGVIALAPCEDDNGVLTNEEIIQMFGQPHKPALQAELLVLSACETGKGRITGDGVNGLSRSLMVAGVSRVVVSLWNIRALSTAFLMIKFYQILKNFPYLKPADVAKALNQAQKWLAGLSCEEAKEELEKLKPYIYQGRRQRKAEAYINYYSKFRTRAPYPFADPKYWAAFTTIGL
ncbi:MULTISPECIES: CHAT domain-containing protein [unclassified Okeania]|nr:MULTISPECIES: CHAT domain-containing protein [unclassified Okeania]NES76672.1 CHAT domain-containing protein [Okeania sp. SIO1H4]NET96008.1 CHAT domain-containing protein [Okeania sp. SIO1H2]